MTAKVPQWMKDAAEQLAKELGNNWMGDEIETATAIIAAHYPEQQVRELVEAARAKDTGCGCCPCQRLREAVAAFPESPEREQEEPRTTMLCDACDGTGRYAWNGERCSKCDATGEVPLPTPPTGGTK